MSQSEERFCPVCNSKSSKIIYRQSFALPHDFPLGNYQLIKSCIKCGMVFADSGKKQVHYNNYYKSLEGYLFETNEKRLTNNKRYRNTYEFIKHYLKNDIAFLDIGCGDGGLLFFLKKNGIKKLTGIDASTPQNKEGISFKSKNLDQISSDDISGFDFISCIGVLEHIYNVSSFLKRLYKTMNNNCFLYIEVPNASNYKDNISSPLQDFNIEHVNHFSINTLQTCLSLIGFEPIISRTLNQPESNKYSMPVISFLFKKNKLFKRNNRFMFEDKLTTEVQEYIKLSSKILSSYDQQLKSKVYSFRKVYIWGLGQLALKMLSLSSFKNIQIIAFIDRNKLIKRLNNIDVITPGCKIEKDIPIIILSTIHADSIKNDIKSFHYTNPIISLES